MTPASGTPSDWVSGERVFAPPPGTVDVDWLVPAVLELAPGADPPQARAALERAWRRRRGTDAATGGATVGTGATGASTPTDPTDRTGTPGHDDPALDAAAGRVLAEALDTFGA